MATPYISLLSKRNISEQLQRHHDQSNLIYNIEDIVKAQTQDYNDTLREVSKSQAEIMRAGTDAICGTIEEGISIVTDGLIDVENAIHHLSNTFDTYLKMIIVEQRYNNILTENIALLLKVSDSQKERQVNIEKGLKFFNDSLRDPSFFEYSLKFFLNAIKDDDTDYLVLDKIGLIYLCSKDHKDYVKAIKYFTKAAKFSKVDTHPNSIRLANILVSDVSETLKKDDRTIDDIKYLTGQSLLWISVAYYEQVNFSEAIKYAQEAFQTAPQLLEAGFYLAKTLAANNQNEKSAIVLYPVIKQDRNYSLKTLSDIDLAPKIEIKVTLEKLRGEAFEEASQRTNKCRSRILLNSAGNASLNKIEQLVAQKSFLACKRAIDLLEKKHGYDFKEAIERNESGRWEALIKPKTFSFSLEELIEYENLLMKYLDTVRRIISKKERKASIQSQLQLLDSNYGSTSRELSVEKKDVSIWGWVTLGSLLSLLIGCPMNQSNWSGRGSEMGIGSWFLGLLGAILSLAGLLGGVLGLITFIGAASRSNSLDNKKDRISSDEQMKRNQISQLEAEIHQLENS